MALAPKSIKEDIDGLISELIVSKLFNAELSHFHCALTLMHGKVFT